MMMIIEDAPSIQPEQPTWVVTVLSQLESGKPVVYHRGYLARDRKRNPDLNRLAADLYKMSVQKRVRLFQRKMDDSCRFEYVVVAIADPPPTETLTSK